MELSKFQESLLVLSAMKTIIENDLRVFKRYIDDEDLKFSLNNKMLVDVCSFLAEWKRFNNYAKNDASIRETMKITSPAIKRISKWKGLEGMRNTLLAHGHRDDNNHGKLTCLNKRYFEADVPHNYAETMLLSEFCVYVISAFIARHTEDYEHAKASLPDWKLSEGKGISKISEFHHEVAELEKHMFSLDPSLKASFGY